MECPKCNSALPEPFTVSYIRPIYLGFSVRFNPQGDLVRLDEPYLNLDKALPDFTTNRGMKKEMFTVTCPDCGEEVKVSDLIVKVRCICAKEVPNGGFCSELDRHFCDDCYLRLMPKICGNCPIRNECGLYLGNILKKDLIKNV
jgi:hypothetical protein